MAPLTRLFVLQASFSREGRNTSAPKRARGQAGTCLRVAPTLARVPPPRPVRAFRSACVLPSLFCNANCVPEYQRLRLTLPRVLGPRLPRTEDALHMRDDVFGLSALRMTGPAPASALPRALNANGTSTFAAQLAQANKTRLNAAANKGYSSPLKQQQQFANTHRVAVRPTTTPSAASLVSRPATSTSLSKSVAPRPPVSAQPARGSAAYDADPWHGATAARPVPPPERRQRARHALDSDDQAVDTRSSIALSPKHRRWASSG